MEDLDCLSVAKFLEATANADFDDCMGWPPDVFGLTSVILEGSGAYRFAADPPPRRVWPDHDEWGDDVAQLAGGWRRSVISGRWREAVTDDGRDGLETLSGNIRETVHDVCIADLRSAEKLSESESAWRLCKSLLELHAAADEACRGIGYPSGMWPNDGTAIAEFLHLANTLLVCRGSLSRLSKQVVCILPKMRTPQYGLTLRSLSHHLAAYRGEVDVDWRTMPWVDRDHGCLNLLCIPRPYKVRSEDFVPATKKFVRRKSPEETRFFEYAPKDSEDGSSSTSLARSVQDQVLNAMREVERVHVVVLPELALNQAELGAVREALLRIGPAKNVPMIVAGVREKGDEATNQISFSMYFAGAWYVLYQHKHHRWRLDEGQIRQYALAGRLAPERGWWEGIRMPRRGVAFVVPNEWLSICPLICEDLARQEPVSGLLRAVGPALVLAVLMDGPQVRSRWPGRYASVLADDPGSSVLTLTSRGMVERTAYSHGPGARREIALWRDSINGWREVDDPGCDGGVLLMLSSRRLEEFTADGRTDNKTAPEIVLSGLASIEESGRGQEAGEGQEPREKIDSVELSLFCFMADGMLFRRDREGRLRIAARTTGKHADSDCDEVRQVCSLIDSALSDFYSGEVKHWQRGGRGAFEQLGRWFVHAADVIHEEELNDSTQAAAAVGKFVEGIAEVCSDHKSLRDYIERFEKRGGIDVDAGLELAAGTKERWIVYVGKIMLWSIHRCMAMERTEGGPREEDERPEMGRIADLFTALDEFATEPKAARR